MFGTVSGFWAVGLRWLLGSLLRNRVRSEIHWSAVLWEIEGVAGSNKASSSTSSSFGTLSNWRSATSYSISTTVKGSQRLLSLYHTRRTDAQWTKEEVERRHQRQIQFGYCVDTERGL